MTEAELSDRTRCPTRQCPRRPARAAGRFPLWPLWSWRRSASSTRSTWRSPAGCCPILEDEWDLSDTQLGLITSVFVFVSTIATIPAGWVADHYRRTRVIGWTLLSWSGLILLSATAVNYVNLLVARAVMGIGQAVDDPASTSFLGDSYPARMRARVFSGQQVSFFLGGGIGLALGGLGGRDVRVAVGVRGRRACPAPSWPSPSFRLREPRRGEAELPESMTWEEIAALPAARGRPHASGAEGLTRGSSPGWRRPS